MTTALDPAARRRLERLALVVALVPLALLVRRFEWVNDDAYITFTYARSLAGGAGFVHHPGGPSVEGSSEPLFLVWSALGMSLGFAPETFARVTTVAATIALAVAVVRLLARRALSGLALDGPAPDGPAPDGPALDGPALDGPAARVALVGAALVLGTSVPLGVWATSGMGVTPFALAIFGTFAATAALADPTAPLPTRRGVALASLVVALTVASRADGAWWVLWLAGAPLVWSLARGERARARALAISAASGVATFLALGVWRLATFGDWLPNTARAKLGFGARALERGGDYVVHFLLTFPGTLVLLGLAGLGLARRRDAWAVGAVAGVAGTFVYAVVVGGDFMAFGRFLVPALPLLVVGAGLGLAEVARGSTRPARALALGLGVLASALSLPPAFGGAVTPRAWREAFRFRHNPTATGAPQPFLSELEQWRAMVLRAEEWSVTGRDLARLAPPDATFVAGAVGALGYGSGLRVFDRHGLLSREVAALPASEALRSPGHDKFVPPSFFAAERPTYDEVGLWPASALDQHPYAGRAVVLGPSERSGYVLWVLPGPGFDELHAGD